VASFGVVELEGAGDGVEDPCRDTPKRAALELGVVLDAHTGEGGDLAAAQSGDPALPGLGYAGLLGGDLGSSRGQELADFGSVVHVVHGTTANVGQGCSIGTPIISDFSSGRGDGLLGA
jgi:hypothetical protein